LVNMLQIESEHWRQKAKEVQTDSNSAQETQQREINFLRQQQKEAVERTRALELDNDEMERTGRVMESSRKDLEVRISTLMERNSFLEHEMEVKQKLQVVVQRLKDELRDTQLELSVLKNKRTSFKRRTPSNDPQHPNRRPHEPSSSSSSVTSATQVADESASSSITLPQPNTPGKGESNVVKAVQEMLGRVHSLDDRLKKCRTMVNPSLLMNTIAAPNSVTATTSSHRTMASGIPVPVKGAVNGSVTKNQLNNIQPRLRGLSENAGRTALNTPTATNPTRAMLATTDRATGRMVVNHSAMKERAVERKQRMDELRRRSVDRHQAQQRTVQSISSRRANGA